MNLIMLGEKVFPTSMATLLLTKNKTHANGNTPLSSRETEVIRCLEQGRSNKSIARHLDITEATVKVHLKTILRKLGLKNRTQAAIWAMKNGITPAETNAEHAIG